MGKQPSNIRKKERSKRYSPLQEVPFPENPLLQAQLKVPGPVEVHAALGEQLLVPEVQLLMAMKGKGNGVHQENYSKFKI